jgi:hypothetical protein
MALKFDNKELWQKIARVAIKGGGKFSSKYTICSSSLG